MLNEFCSDKLSIILKIDKKYLSNMTYSDFLLKEN